MMGDVVVAGDSSLRLRVEVAGTAPIERVEVRNGTRAIRTLRPYGKNDLGSRVKLLWSGAEVRGRGRMVSWDGALTVRQNSIRAVQPVNFWNPLTPPRPAGSSRVEWRSTTTGGHAGLILSLGRPLSGDLEIRTEQRAVTCSVGSVGLGPKTWDCGGLDKKLSVYRLPDPPAPSIISFELPLNRLCSGDNPIWVRVDQEDGHVAWSSPIYVVVDR
jgi:hypothetical protein